MSKSDIGIYGLGVMGRNLALNLEEKGYYVSVYNRMTVNENFFVRDFIAEAGAEKSFTGTESAESFVKSLKRPGKILMMVKAGAPVDSVIEELLPYLESGDIIIDGGNSNFNDTDRRVDALKQKGILFAGMGVSGGEEGARHGPSLMPGGNFDAWAEIKPIFKSIAARAFDGSACCRWVGTGGAGHFVKMVHNGIEYADMQLIAEAYHLMKVSMGMNTKEIAEIFNGWNQSSLNSYLLEITAQILTANDDDGEPLVDKILDSAGQKGTGKWTAISSLELEIPLPGITEAVYARFFSSLIELRAKIAKNSPGKINVTKPGKSIFLKNLAHALQAARMVAYAEGFYMITTAGKEYGWDINPASVAKIWQGGCIIQSELLKPIEKAFRNNPEPEHLFLEQTYITELENLQTGWRNTVKFGIDSRVPLPCSAAYLTQYDTLHSERLPANLIQAQRDFFGAHTYERSDRPRGTFFHSDWQSLISD